MNSGAIFSTDHKRRYRLWRAWTPSQLTAVFIGQNPSTANETTDDPTIRRCMGFAKAWGRGGIEMVNLFADISSDPANIQPVIEDHNLDVVHDVARRAGVVVACWGRLPTGWDGSVIIRLMAKLRGIEVHCFGRNQDGSPRHPLYLPGDAPLETLWGHYESDGWAGGMSYQGWD